MCTSSVKLDSKAKELRGRQKKRKARRDFFIKNEREVPAL